MMWSVTNSKRLAGCHRWRNGRGGPLLTKQGKRSATKGLQASHSVWGSPVSAAAIAKRRIKESTTAVENFLTEDNSRSVIVLTLTLPHTQDMDLSPLLSALSGAHAALFKRVWRERFGVVHFRKSVEITHGWNGFHPHEHILLFMDKALSVTEIDAMKAEVHKVWAEVVVKAGAVVGLELAAPSWKHGAIIQQSKGLDDARALATYAAKANTETWSAAAEVAGGTFKRAKGDNRTPWQVLEDIGTGQRGTPSYARDVAIWLEYETATEGCRQSSWSGGAADALGVKLLKDEEIKDDDQDDEDDQDKEEHALVEVNPDDWDAGLSIDVEKRLELRRAIEAARDNDAGIVVAIELLESWGVRFTVIDLPIPKAGALSAWKIDGSALLAA